MRYTTTDGPKKPLNAIQEGSLGGKMGIAVVSAWCSPLFPLIRFSCSLGDCSLQVQIDQEPSVSLRNFLPLSQALPNRLPSDQ